MTEIWSQTHKKRIKNAHRSAKNSKFSRGRPPNPINARGSPHLELSPRHSMISSAGPLLNTRRRPCRQSVYLSVYLFIYPSVNPSIPRNQNQIKSRSLVRLKTGPQGFWGSGEIGYLFSGSWGALVIIFRDLRSKLIVLGIKGALQKCKKSHLKKSLHFV